MAFCSKCGTQMEDGAKFCPKCGNPSQGTEQAAGQAAGAQANQNNFDFSQKINEFSNTTDTTSDFAKEDIDQNKGMAILSYLSWLVLIPLLAAPKSKFARFHANQGLVLAITEIVWWIAFAVLRAIIYSISYRLGFIVSILGLVNILFLVFAVLGIVNAANGKAKELPIIGKIVIVK